MRKTALFLVLLASVASAEDFLHEPAGVKIAVPEGWERDGSREGGSTIFAATLAGSGKEHLRFEVETSDAQGFEPKAWLLAESNTRKNVFKTVTSKFAPEEDRVIGGRAAVGYTMGGTRDDDGEEAALHYRVYAVPNDYVFVQLTFLAYNSAELTMDSSVKQMLDAIAFLVPKAPEADLSVAEGVEATAIDDPKGNVKLTLPPGWTVESPVPQGDADQGEGLRLVAARKDATGNNRAVLIFRRFGVNNPAVFTKHTPTTLLQEEKDLAFRIYFDEGSQYSVDPSDGTPFGGLSEGTGSFVAAGHSADDVKQIREAEQQQKRGLKVEIPKIPMKVIKGRVALFSPHIYIATVEFAKGYEDNPKLQAEVEQMLDSVAFLSTQAKPPALTVGQDEVGNTKDDPALAKDQKGIKVTKEASSAGKVQDTLNAEYTLPAGFKKIDSGHGESTLAILAAQDADHRWVRIVVHALSHKAAAAENKKLIEKQAQYLEWRSNTESAGRFKKIPEKPKSMSFAGISGDGGSTDGVVETFRASRTFILAEKSGWRYIVEVETRAGGDEVFKKGIDTFLKSFKIKK